MARPTYELSTPATETAGATRSPSHAVTAESLWFAYHRGRWVLQDVSLQVSTGAFVGVVGPSGSGKTTLLKLMAGFLRPTRGSLTLLGQPLRRRVPASVRRRVGYIPQQLGLVRGMTALDNVLMGSLGRVGNLRSILALIPAHERLSAIDWLERLGMADKAETRAYQLSGGQRQRVAIARTLLQKPDIIFADEFVSDLDQALAIEILELLKQISRERNATVVSTMHEMELVQRFADEVVVVVDGRASRDALNPPDDEVVA